VCIRRLSAEKKNKFIPHNLPETIRISLGKKRYHYGRTFEILNHQRRMNSVLTLNNL